MVSTGSHRQSWHCYYCILSTGVDEILAKHIAHLFIRDPVFVFAESLEHEDIENESDHFEV